MNRKSLVTSIVAHTVLVAILSSCYSASRYSGDGHLVDNGLFAANDRYVLDLGTIALSEQGTSTYHLENLPTASFVVGLEIAVSPGHNAMIENRSVKPTVLIELWISQGETLIRNQSSLDTWAWSVRAGDNKAFVYRREQPPTLFTPITDGKYELKVTIVQPDFGGSKYTARLLAKSGGWK